MKRLLIILAMTCWALTVPGAETARVVGNRVNLRAEPQLRGEVVGQVQRNDQLSVIVVEEEWVAVRPPADIIFWVHSDFLEGTEVAAPRLNVRAGPGINHAVVARLERGAEVVKRDTFAEWVGIAAPTNAKVWIAREFVELPEPVAEPPPPQAEAVAPREPAPEPESPMVEATPAVPTRPAPPSVERPTRVPPPPDLDLIPLDGQGDLVEREGTLRPAGFVLGRPSRYRLTRSRGPIIETICYVKGNEEQLHALLGRAVRISGREYWVQGARHPVLVPQSIILTMP